MNLRLGGSPEHCLVCMYRYKNTRLKVSEKLSAVNVYTRPRGSPMSSIMIVYTRLRGSRKLSTVNVYNGTVCSAQGFRDSIKQLKLCNLKIKHHLTP